MRGDASGLIFIVLVFIAVSMWDVPPIKHVAMDQLHCVDPMEKSGLIVEGCRRYSIMSSFQIALNTSTNECSLARSDRSRDEAPTFFSKMRLTYVDGSNWQCEDRVQGLGTTLRVTTIAENRGDLTYTTEWSALPTDNFRVIRSDGFTGTIRHYAYALLGP